MEIAQLEAFVRVARDGTFTRAAEALNLTQPAISIRIASLEAELGGTLFERRGRQLFLTPLGDMFLPYAERTLTVMADGIAAARNFNAGRTGHIKIAAPAPFMLSFLMDTLDAFRREHPSVDILMRERDKATILELLHDNIITLGLVNAPVFDSRLAQLARYADPIRAVVSASHPLAAHEAPVPIEALHRHTIYRVSMFPEMTAFIDALVENSRAGSGGAVIALPMVMALHLVLAGQGMTFLNESYVRSHVSSGELVILEIADMPRLVSHPVFIARKDTPLDTMHQEFLRIFRARWRHLEA